MSSFRSVPKAQQLNESFWLRWYVSPSGAGRQEVLVMGLKGPDDTVSLCRRIKRQCYDGTLMARVSRVRRWLLLTGLSMLTAACGSQPANPNTLPSWIGAYPGSSPQKKGSDFVFETKDPAEKVLDFYQQQLIQN